MKAVLIDDERLARVELRRLLAAHSEIEIVAEASNVAEGLRLIEAAAPDVIFLDIQMPDGSGFDLLAALESTPAVIFTSAYDHYAIRAFEVSALDYLLKPIEPQRLAQAIGKMQSRSDAPTERPLAPTNGKVFIKDGERCWFVTLDEIVLFESEGNYTRVHFDQNRPLMLRSLNQLEARLDPQRFLRVSRRQIVNLKCVVDLKPTATGGMVLILKDGLRVPMSRRRAARFRQQNQL
ncbi:LytR/AlgR family response regulator transcription factor [Tahibacter amnicola]|uniref:LytTR family DNA-binding domain-containing protein n=1 Tax=Tahibacter amnicola TaxID=2976241 RepID=A0ABY6BG83_9GAMM|nr:LytTR family DNA-binding domain-containing protein [Tahibacter amnicola]UXI69036.1 LytTR family DNA-binding domain-containing protein [Tahibacter amnicola]